jgi:outer membrane cobalamin receptor
MPLGKEISLIGRIQNLFNKNYDQANGFRAPPLNFLLGFRANFGNQ